MRWKIRCRARYDGDAIERFAGELGTGLGRREIGITDGGGYELAVRGPKVDPGMSLDDPRASFYRHPNTHRAVADIFGIRTEVGASSNYSNFAYAGPSLLELQFGFSFTPIEAKELPFPYAGAHLLGRQADIWEGAIRYETDLGLVSLSAYGGFAEGRAEHKLPTLEGASDLGEGVKADYALDEDITFLLGRSFRQSNAHAFDVKLSFQPGITRTDFISTAVSYQ